MTRPHPAITRPWLIVALITAFGAGLRLYAIGTLPPGLYRDEAYNGLDALHVLEGARPIFFEANNGREPLFIYLQALSLGLLGRSPAALRLVSALVGILSIPSVYALGARLYGQRVGILAAFLSATTVWTLNLSRIGFRAGTFFPLAACSLLLLWQGLDIAADGACRQGLLCLVGAGLLYGVCFYTYLAARLSVVALLLFALYTLVRDHRRFWLCGWLAFGVASLLVALPLFAYFAHHWETTLGRTAQVSILNPIINGGDPWGTFVRHLWRTFRAFVDRGDTIPRHNVPGRPIFDPLLGLAFWGGLILSIRKAWRRSAYALGLIWLGVMIWSTILAEDAPHFLRASGILPVLFFFPAIGLAEFWSLLTRYGWERLGGILVWVILALSAMLGTGVYWRHVHSTAAYYNLEAGATEMAVEVNTFLGSAWQGGLKVSHAPASPLRHVYMAPRLWQNWPSVRYLCPQSPALSTEPPSAGRMVVSPGADLLLVLWPFEDNQVFLPMLPTGRLIAVREGAQERGDLEPASRLLYVTLRTLPPSVVPTNADARWQEGIALVGYTTEERSDRQLAVTLYWRAEQQVPASYTVFCHILKGEQPIGQHDGPPTGGYYTTNLWRPGDTIADSHLIDLAEDCDQGDCQMVVGLYAWETMTRLQRVDSQGQPSAETTVTLDIVP